MQCARATSPSWCALPRGICSRRRVNKRWHTFFAGLCHILEPLTDYLHKSELPRPAPQLQTALLPLGCLPLERPRACQARPKPDAARLLPSATPLSCQRATAMPQAELGRPPTETTCCVRKHKAVVAAARAQGRRLPEPRWPAPACQVGHERAARRWGNRVPPAAKGPTPDTSNLRLRLSQ